MLEFYQTQRYIEASAYLKTIYAENTADPKELAQVAYANMMAGNLPFAEISYLKLYAQQPGSLPVLFNLASISRRRGDDLKAKRYYLDIIKIDSTNFNVYKQLAAMIFIPLNPEKIYYLKKANAINQTNPDVAYDLAQSLNLTEKNDSAYTVLQTALAADTSNLLLLKQKLPISIALKKQEEAILTGEKLLTYGDSSTKVLTYLGTAYFGNKNYEKALSIFKTPEPNETTYYYTALCYRELNNYTLAAVNIKLAIKEGISKCTSDYYKILGAVYEKNGQIQNADYAYHKSLEFENPGDVYYNLGLLNEFKLRNNKAAIKYYRQFLRSKPDPEKYKEVIVYVKTRITDLSK